MKKIISKKYAQKLIKEGKAKEESCLKSDRHGDIYVAITRYDNQTTVHYREIR